MCGWITKESTDQFKPCSLKRCGKWPGILKKHHCFRRILSKLCISVPLSTNCTDFAVNSKFSANRGSYLQCLSWLKHWTKWFCADSSRSDVNRMQVITNKIHLSTEWDCFFPENLTDFVFEKFPEENQSKIIHFNSVINEYSFAIQDVQSTPSWHKWLDSELPFMMLYNDRGDCAHDLV